MLKEGEEKQSEKIDVKKIKVSETMQQKIEAKNEEDAVGKAIYDLDQIRKTLFHDYDAKIEKIGFINKTGNYSCKADLRPIPWYIFMPNGTFRFFWNLFVFVLAAYVLIIVPVDIAFNLDCVFVKDNGESLHLIYLLSSLVMMIDILLNFVTARLDDRMEFVFDLPTIFSMYISGEFLLDALSAVPWDRIEKFKLENCFTDGMDSSKTYFFGFLLYVTKLMKGLALLDEVFVKYAVFMKLTKLIMIILYSAHCIGNLFSGISPTVYMAFLAGCKTVECVQNMYKTNFLNIYTFSVYIGIVFFNGNDLLTTKNWEMLFLIIINVYSMIVSAALFGYLTEIVVQMGSSGLSPILQQKLDVMNEYMRFKEFEDGFFVVIEEYLNNLWLKQRNIIYEDAFFDDLSSSLHKIVLIEQWQKNYFHSSNLIRIVSIDFYTTMIPMLKPKIFMAKDIIIAEGDISSDVFFNSKNGFCSLQIGGNLVKWLGPWNYFGEIALFLRMKRRTATVTCLKDSDFLMIESKHFEKLLMDFPEDTKEIGRKAKEDLMGSMKLYPSSLFAKLVPRNAKKDYLARKCLISMEEEEERVFFATKLDAKVNLNQYKSSIDQIEGMILDVKSKLNKCKEGLKKHNI